MHQGKHQEYEKRLHDALIAQMSQQPPQTTGGTTTAASQPLTGLPNGSGTTSPLVGIPINKIATEKESNGTNAPIQSKEAWPSLSTSPVNNKENKLNGKTSKLQKGFIKFKLTNAVLSQF